MNSQFNVDDIHSGILNKCGGKVKSWNKRWFVLRSDYCLYYYKDIAKGHLGVITLRDTQFKVRQGEAGDISWPKNTKMECALTMVTTNRTYYMQATSAEEAAEWLRVLMETKKKLAESCAGMKSLTGSTSSRQDIQKDGSSQENEGKERDERDGSSEHHNGEVTENRDTSAVDDEQLSIYDVAKAPEDQPGGSLQTDSSPETKPKMDESTKQAPQAIYDDVSFEESTQVSSPEIKNEVTPPVTQSHEIYDQVNEESPSVYDAVGPDPSSSIQSQPLPPLPTARSISKDGQPIYEDIPDNAQPLYEPIDTSDGGNKLNRENAQEAEDSGGEECTAPPPPLPPKEDDILPPLPPKDSLPPLPPKDDHNSLPPLPEKTTPPSPRRATPPSPHRDIHVPPLPEKDTPPSPHKRSNILPLPDEHSPGSPRRRSNSPSSTPPKKPSPTPRRRKISPTPSDEPAEVKGQHTSESQNGASGKRGMALFHERGEKLDLLSEQDTKKRAESIRTMEHISGDPKLSIHQKAKFAETLREVEHERLMASEERFRWERERMKLEEERRKFEEERKKLQEEIEVTRQQLTQKDT